MGMEMGKAELNLLNGGGGGGILKLPVGFRFHPTDEELVEHYLRRKVLSLPLPAHVIPDHLDLFHTYPWDLPGDPREKRYFFCKRRRSYGNGWINGIINGVGYWKVKGKEKYVLGGGGSNQAAAAALVVGVKKSLVFRQLGLGLGGKKRRHGLICGRSTNNCCCCCYYYWVMHEYRLAALKLELGMEDWVVCRIFQKKRKSRRGSKIAEMELVDAHHHNSPPPRASSSSSSSSSCAREITEISSKACIR